MASLIRPEAVEVELCDVSYDDVGDVVSADARKLETSCLVVPGACADLDASRPNGARVALTLHFPKTWAEGLKGACVTVRGRRYRVVGDPQPYTAGNVPGAYNMPVEVEAVDG